MKRTFVDAVGRTRSGDQLHKCTGWIDEADYGRVVFGGCNAHCNNHLHLTVLRAAKGEKTKLRLRPSLFCRKCFGDNPMGHDLVNATIEP